MERIFLYIVLCYSCCLETYGQGYKRGVCKNYIDLFLEKSDISGIVKDESGAVVPFANITLLQKDETIIETTTNFDGEYQLKSLSPNIYKLKVSFVGYQTKKMNKIQLERENIRIDVVISAGIELPAIECFLPGPILFDKDQTTSGRTFTRDEIQNMPF